MTILDTYILAVLSGILVGGGGAAVEDFTQLLI